MKHYKQPIYIELPCDMVRKSISYDVYKQGTPVSPVSNTEELNECLEELSDWIDQSKHPVIVAGVELARYQLGEVLTKFAERNNIPIVSTLLSKSVINELHPLFKGVYCGTGSNDKVKCTVDHSDCLIMLGVLAADMFAHIDKRSVFVANIEETHIKNHAYANIQFIDFCKELFKKGLRRSAVNTTKSMRSIDFEPENKPVTTVRLFEKINSILTDQMVVVCDIGDCLYGAGDLVVSKVNRFFCPAYYNAMGVAIPGALGIQTALPTIRPIVIVGDGASQMSLLELSTIANRKLNPIIFVLNNKGFLTERLVLDGDYNDIRLWDYHKIPEIIKYGSGYEVLDEMELDRVINIALTSKQLSVINVHIDSAMSPALRRMIDNKK
jgi:indolepyruvate decarboxylase